MFAQAVLLSSVPRGPVVPADALLDTGGRQFVFVTDGAGYFEPRAIKTGHRIEGLVQVLDGVKPGEQVASSATFFVDSESQLRAALEGYKPQPAEARQPAAAARTVAIALTSDAESPSRRHDAIPGDGRHGRRAAGHGRGGHARALHAADAVDEHARDAERGVARPRRPAASIAAAST